MEMILFIGVQATGKSTFYTQRFFATHVRLSLDMLNTRNKQQQFMNTCFATQQAFVLDNTNPTKAERAVYIAQAKQYKYSVVGYYFQSKIEDAIQRNNTRTGKARIPGIGIRGTFSKLELPDYDEGFDTIFYVTMENNTFAVQEWNNEV